MHLRKNFILMIAALLFTAVISGCGKSVPSEYTVRCTDENGDPVTGAEGKLCLGDKCSLIGFDENGEAVVSKDFEGGELTMISIPKGYLLEGAGTYTLNKETPEYKFVFKKNETGKGDKITFSAEGAMDGKKYDDSIFSQYDLTIINLWEPWCGPCCEELPHLEKLYNEYDGRLLVLGVTNRMPQEGYSVEQVINENGITYPVVNYNEDFKTLSETGYFPTSLFVDSEGNILAVSEKEIAQAVVDGLLESIQSYKDEYPTEYAKDEYHDAYEKCLSDRDYAAEWYMDEFMDGSITDKGAFSGNLDYSGWKKLIEARISKDI